MLIAVILAGGRGTRLGSANKALVQLQGKPLIRHVMDRIAGQADELSLNCARGQAEFAAFGLPIEFDAPESAHLPGVFRGLQAALRRLVASPTRRTSVLTVPVDTPFLPRRLASELARAAGSGGVAFAADAERGHAVIGLWSRAAAERGLDALKTYDNESVEGFLRAQGGIDVRIMLAPDEAFLNVNTPEDMRAAEAFAARG